MCVSLIQCCTMIRHHTCILLPLLVALLSFPLLPTGVSADIGCYVQGECIGGVTVGISHLGSSSECHESCKNALNCEFFTYFITDGVCLQLQTCPELDEGCSEECISGDVECDVLVRCDIQGYCDGAFVDYVEINDKELCIEACWSRTECEWWTFDSAENLCTLLSSCLTIDESCISCVSGERDCGGQGELPGT